MRVALRGRRWLMFRPIITMGAFTNIIPKIDPAITAAKGW
jgi:hypothetical protein